MINQKSFGSVVPARVCLVTEELSGIGGSGGIGAAFFELAKLLASNLIDVDILYCPIDGSINDQEKERISNDFHGMGIKLTFLDYLEYVELPISYEKKSYAISQYLSRLVVGYSYIHFHDYKGLGFFSTSLKRQGLSFKDTNLVVQLHGPTRWTIEENKGFFIHEDQLKIDFMERMSITQADFVVSPSMYLIDWLKGNGYTLPKNTQVIKNVCSDLSNSLGLVRRLHSESLVGQAAVTDVICFARHEDRKGFSIFCDALDLINDKLAESKITVTFLGKFGMVGSQPSGIYLVDRAKKWKFSLKIRSGFARNAAAEYIVSRNSPLVVIPSPAENSPYTVLESIVLGVPVISSLGGGGRELFNNSAYQGLCDINAAQIAEKILMAIEGGIGKPMPSETPIEIEKNWLDFHKFENVNSNDVGLISQPKVTFAITHFERPEKLTDAIISAVRQTYKNIEILVVDDGSTSKETVAALKDIEVLLDRVDGKLLRQQNSYLGAARNTALRAASGDYICFLDDDDIAKPDLIEKLVTAAVSGDFDVVNCMNIFMNEACRGDVLGRSENVPKKVAYIPLGGPISLAPTENCLGAATALFKRDALINIGGYTELKGVGHEDYELFIRFVQAGKKLTIVPLPLYYYEVGRPSMLSRTSMVANFRRCFDALDISLKPDAMKDIISLSVGKNLLINSHNRQHWIYSNTSTGEIRNRILTQPLNRVDTLNCLIELASQEKALKIRMAFEDDLSQISPDSIVDDSNESLDDLMLQMEQSDVGKKRIPVDPVLANIQLTMALGRYSTAVDEICSYLQTSDVFADPLIGVLQELISSNKDGGVGAAQWAKLAAAMRKVKFSRKLVIEGMSCLLLVSLLGGLFEYASSIVPVLVDNQNSEYLKAYPDVVEAIDTGGFSSGFDHYLSFGFGEGRKGFGFLVGVFRIVDRLPDSDCVVTTVFSKLGEAPRVIKLFEGYSCVAV